MKIGYNRNTNGKEYSGIILAAGLSSRMGDFKPLLYVDGRTAIAGITETLRGAGVDDVIVVTGFSRDRLLPSINELRITEAFNEGYERGMFSSIRTGLAKATELWPEKKGHLLIPVDCPIVSIDTIRSVMEGGGRGDQTFAVPTFEGKKGHPLLIPSGAVEEIMKGDEAVGLKGVTDASKDRLIRVPVNDEGCVMDMDTPEGYEEIKKFVSSGFRREKLGVTTSRRRIIMVRHGETIQHESPMFIGQYDVPLSDGGKKQALTAAEAVADIIKEDIEKSESWVEGVSLGHEPMPPIENIYCSDLSRSRETAEIMAEEIRRRYGGRGYAPKVISLDGLREISLGDWDGRAIAEIKEECPEDYEARGNDIFTFKKGNSWENFYDLQYRVMKALRRILAGDDGRNIIISAHSGVIRALENNLKGMRVDDGWQPVEKGGVRIWEAPPLP